MKRPALIVAVLAGLCLSLATTASTLQAAPVKRPARALLLIIDGLHWEAPERLELPNFHKLCEQGTYVRFAQGALPLHPTGREWASMHTTSLPNPVMVSGTLFIRPDQKLIQDCFYPNQLTAHVTNATAYRSLNQSNSFSMVRSARNIDALEEAMRLLSGHDIRYMRIHLQDSGTGGWKCHDTEKDVPWRRNIWGEGSPYIEEIENADRLLGRLVDHLKEVGKWEETLLVVTTDHGEAPTGAHPPLHPDSSITPMVFLGPGIAKNRVLDYAEQIDIVPTICDFLGVEPPNKDGGAGRVLEEIKAGKKGKSPAEPRRLYTLNALLRDYQATTARLRLKAVNDAAIATELDKAANEFYSLKRFSEWPRARSVERLIRNNQRVLRRLKTMLQKPPTGGKANQLTDAEKAEGWQLLFDGKTLDGWTASSKANWRVRKGKIVVSKGEPGLLHTVEEYDNFVLKTDFRSEPGANSAVFIRSPAFPTETTNSCYEINIADIDDLQPYHPYPTGSLVSLARCEGNHDTTAWQRFEIAAEGGHITVSIDGRKVLYYQDPYPKETGYVGLQFNRGQVEFRNIKLKPIEN